MRPRCERVDIPLIRPPPHRRSLQPPASFVVFLRDMRTFVTLWLLLTLLQVLPAQAQSWGTVTGVVTDEASTGPIEGVAVIVFGTNFGTATDEKGHYSFRLPEGTHTLEFSALGYRSLLDTVHVVRDGTTELHVSLREGALELEEILVEDEESVEAGVHRMNPEAVRDIPAPFPGVFASIKVMPGVASNNELSNQYSVRGGGYNENLIFLNGFEIHLPFRPRQGEQEGLGLLNPDLTDNITFYTGGFPPRYGGKLSSALEVTYRKPEPGDIRGGAQLSTLDAGGFLEAATPGGRASWILGARKARASRFFSTQELKGNYQPDYTDLQASLSVRVTDGHELEAIGIWSRNRFILDPRTRKTYYGTISLDPTQPSNLQSMWIAYDPGSNESDGYDSGFVGARTSNHIAGTLRAEHDLSLYTTVETEDFEMAGKVLLFLVDPESGNPNTGEGHVPIGNASEEEVAHNRVAVRTLTAQGRWLLHGRRHAPEAGWMVRRLHFDDQLGEKSIVTGQGQDGERVRIVVDSLFDAAALDASQAAFYAQDVIEMLPQTGRMVGTFGVRADYFSLNDEWTVSPRALIRYRLSANTDLLASLGLYHQAPTYRELRGKPETGTGILGSINSEIRSQRSLQLLAGVSRFLPRHRTTLRAEAFWKRLSNLISYDVENVRVEYSGRNDAEGHAYGLDLQLRGELVPGMESWINYSYLVARERFLPQYVGPRNEGLVPRPSDQRHTFSAYFQDYVPRDPTWRIHLRALFGSGFPYTPPVPGPRIGNIVVQAPGDRLSGRFTEYKRIDAGVTKEIELVRGPRGRPVRLEATAEILNLFDMINTVAYSWVPGAEGIWRRIPTRLTPRTYNLRVRVEF